MDPGMEHVVDRFPELAASIQDRFHDDQSFREMCSDYAETMAALQRWQASAAPQKAARVAEYGELVRELEAEIVAALQLPMNTKHVRHDRI